MPIWGSPVIRTDRPAPAVTMYPSWLRFGLWFLTSSPFLAGGGYLVAVGQSGYEFLGLGLIVFFGLFPAFLLWKLLTRRPVLVVDEHGIAISTSIWGRKFVPWSEITALFARHGGPGRSWITIELVNSREVAATAGFIARLSNRLFGNVYIMTASLPLAIADTLYEIGAVAPDHVLVIGGAQPRRR